MILRFQCGFRVAWVVPMSQRRFLTVLLLGILTSSVPPRLWAQSNDPVFDAKGFQANHDYFSALPFEHVDTVNGALVLTFTDLVLPGNAGSELRFQRTYNSKDMRWTFGIAGLVLQLMDSYWPNFLADDQGAFLYTASLQNRSRFSSR